MACTSPALTVRLSPLRISLPSISTCKSLTSSNGIEPPYLSFDLHFFRDRGPDLSDRALQADRDQLLRLDREFHRQLLQHVLDEAIDYERGRFLRRQTALAAIEQHFFRNLRGRGLVLEHGR